MSAKLVFQILGSIALASQLVACASVNSVSLTPIPAGRSKPVTAMVSKTIFLGFNFDNDFIDPLVTELKNQCPNGTVSGILTKDETTHYFLVWTKKVTATGFCNASSTKSAKLKSNRKTASDATDAAEENE